MPSTPKQDPNHYKRARVDYRVALATTAKASRSIQGTSDYGMHGNWSGAIRRLRC